MARALDEMGKPRGALDFGREFLVNEPDTAARIKALGGEDGAAKGPRESCNRSDRRVGCVVLSMPKPIDPRWFRSIRPWLGTSNGLTILSGAQSFSPGG